MTTHPLSLALDQNFPMPLIQAVADYLPPDIQVRHLPAIDRRLSDLSDRQLIIALRQLGFDGLVTNNYKMLGVPEEIAAIVKTKSVLIAIEKMGHDPIRAVGALLVELPGIRSHIRPGRSNVFKLNYPYRRPQDAWDYLSQVAKHRGVEAARLWDQVFVTDVELGTPVLER